MFRIFLFKTAWRNLASNKGYAFINIGGLAIGIDVAVLGIDANRNTAPLRRAQCGLERARVDDTFAVVAHHQRLGGFHLAQDRGAQALE